MPFMRRSAVFAPALSREGAVGTARRYFPSFLAQRARCLELDRWTGDGESLKPFMPKQATDEFKQLGEVHQTPWLGLVVNSVSQVCCVEGHTVPGSGGNTSAWDRFWQTNSLDARQMPVHRGAVHYGLSYVRVLRGKQPLTDEETAIIRGVSPKECAVFYEPDSDEYGVHALEATLNRVRGDDGSEEVFWAVTLWDAEDEYHLTCDFDGDKMTYVESRHHGTGVVPFVRFENLVDLEGDVMGEVEPFIPLAGRINQDTFDRLIVQRFGAWVIRYAAGLVKPETDQEARAAAIALRVTDMLVSESADTKFGSLPATDLGGFIAARDADIRDLAAVSQTPPHHLLGLSPNLSAEALAAAESALMRKVDERRRLFGERWEQVLRLACFVMGDAEGAKAFSAQVRWKDIESRSLAQVADALGKLATMLEVPVEMLWKRIPNWSEQDQEEALALREQRKRDEELMNELLNVGQPDDPNPPAPDEPNADPSANA